MESEGEIRESTQKMSRWPARVEKNSLYRMTEAASTYEDFEMRSNILSSFFHSLASFSFVNRTLSPCPRASKPTSCGTSSGWVRTENSREKGQARLG